MLATKESCDGPDAACSREGGPARRVCCGRPRAVVPQRVSRRWVVRGLGATTLAPIVACPSRSLAADELRFGLTPVFLSNDLELLTRLRTYLGKATGRPVRLVQRRTYQEITALLVSGQLDAAWICGYPYIRYRDQLGLLAVPVWQGQPLYQAYIIVDAERAAPRLEDLEGDIHAFSDPDSNSGYLMTRARLAEMRRRPDTFFRRSFFTYGHRNVVRAVASGLAESGSVDGYVWEVMTETEPELTHRTRVLTRSDWLGFPPVAASREARDSDRTRALKSALTRMHDDDQGREVLRMLRLDRFEQGGPDLFDGIAKKVAQVERFG